MEPGIGAIEYARSLVAGLTREQAAVCLRKEPDDQRVKRCDYCRYHWRDTSLRNNKRTCCDECKISLKSTQRRQQRADKELLKGESRRRKKSKIQTSYVWWLEYPFWINEYEMLKYSWKYEVPYGSEILDFIQAKSAGGGRF